MRSIAELELDHAAAQAEKYGFQVFVITPEEMESMTRKGRADAMEFLVNQFEIFREQHQRCDSPFM